MSNEGLLKELGVINVKRNLQAHDRCLQILEGPLWDTYSVAGGQVVPIIESHRDPDFSFR